MKVIFVLFDSLNRRSLERLWRQPAARRTSSASPRAASRSTSHYVGSLPCMPARRDMHTGRLTFLHRGWGPLEPFDNSFAEILHRAACTRTSSSDHYHYWEDGGATYHTRYDTFEFVRGQERDPWKAMVRAAVGRLRESITGSQFNDRAATSSRST